jgi:hypothetical protein
MNQPLAILLYRATCAKCRVISLAIVWLSLGTVRRVPVASAAARQLREERGIPEGKLALITPRRVFAGRSAVSALLTLPLTMWSNL